jgi:hypothetical protein
MLKIQFTHSIQQRPRFVMIIRWEHSIFSYRKKILPLRSKILEYIIYDQAK